MVRWIVTLIHGEYVVANPPERCMLAAWNKGIWQRPAFICAEFEGRCRA